VLLAGLGASAATIRAKQGDAVRVIAAAPAAQARFGNRTIRLFPQSDGSGMGLMPISANHAPGTFPLQYLDASGKVIRSDSLVVANARFPSQNVVLRREIAELAPAPGDREAMDAFRSIVTEQRFWAEPFESPLPGCMVSRFGVKRYINGKPTGSYHGGIDQRGAEGSPIHAIAAGTVRLVRAFSVSGNTVGVDHGQGLLSLYLHMSKFQVQDGAHVQKGDVLGYVGSTGRSTAPHLHWSVMANGLGVNPAQWIVLEPCSGASGSSQKKRHKKG
jgi:murein DD-endopeptidase MepM/ murein hydrolase activator NlpD